MKSVQAHRIDNNDDSNKNSSKNVLFVITILIIVKMYHYYNHVRDVQNDTLPLFIIITLAS